MCYYYLLNKISSTSNFLITILPSKRISVADSAQVGPTYVFCKVIIRRTKVSPPLSTFKASILPAKASEETSEKMEGLVSFQPFPSSVIQRRFSTVYLHRLTRSSSSSSCAPLRAQQVSFSSQFHIITIFSSLLKSFCSLLNFENVIVEDPFVITLIKLAAFFFFCFSLLLVRNHGRFRKCFFGIGG